MQMRIIINFLILVLILANISCSAPSNSVAGGNNSTTGSNIQLQETSAVPSNKVNETIHMNNCGGKADAEQIAQHSMIVSLSGEGQIGVSVQILQASVTAKYTQSNNISKSQKLVAPPGTNMEFVIAWVGKDATGVITVDGKPGQAAYSVQIPLESIPKSKFD